MDLTKTWGIITCDMFTMFSHYIVLKRTGSLTYMTNLRCKDTDLSGYMSGCVCSTERQRTRTTIKFGGSSAVHSEKYTLIVYVNRKSTWPLWRRGTTTQEDGWRKDILETAKVVRQESVRKTNKGKTQKFTDLLSAFF